MVGNYKLVFKEEFLLAARDAYEYYNRISTIVANRFLDEVEYIVQLLETTPHVYSYNEYDYRQAGTRKFPYVLIYEIDDTKNEVIIFTLFPTRMNPFKKPKKND
jgi:mRNA-degrading endonuclease RelE of RelBE toxin-antitoxin system